MERFGRSIGDCEAGRWQWRELQDCVYMLLADPSSRLCAAVRGWYSPVDTRWLLTALLQTTRATVYWPWDVAPKAKPEEIKRANDSLMERWG